MQKQETHEDRRHNRPQVKMCWQQKLLAGFVVLLSGGGALTGIQNRLKSSEDTKSIEVIKTSVEEKVQKMSEQYVELKANVEELKRGTERVDKSISKLDAKIDRLIERK